MICHSMPEQSEVINMPRKRTSYSFDELSHAVASGGKKYVRYEEGAKLFSIGRNSFIELANDADAVFKYHGCAIINIQKIEKFIEENWDLEKY